MSPAERLKVLLFLALFFGATGFLFTLLSCGTEYWLLAAESCSQPEDSYGGRGLREGKSSTKAVDGVRIFHEGLFWRCSFTAVSDEHTIWDLWISNQPPSKVCHTAFLFPFPVYEPMQSRGEPHGFPANPYEHHSAIVFRTFWSIFLVTGLAAVIIGGFVVICAGPLTNHRLFKVGGALLFCGARPLEKQRVKRLEGTRAAAAAQDEAMIQPAGTHRNRALRRQRKQEFSSDGPGS
ncbi:transmembrane protein 182-like isoform X2 [Epinephelus lanceolatus]